MNRRAFTAGLAATALAMYLPAQATAEEVIDPKLTALFGEDWESRKVTLGDSIDAWDATFKQYTKEEDGVDRSYHIPDVATITLEVAETDQVSAIDVYPLNPLFTLEEANTILMNFLPDDAIVYETGNDPSGFGSQVEGWSDQFVADVLPETYADTEDETPTQGVFSAQFVEGFLNDPVADSELRRVEIVHISLASRRRFD